MSTILKHTIFSFTSILLIGLAVLVALRVTLPMRMDGRITAIRAPDLTAPLPAIRDDLPPVLRRFAATLPGAPLRGVSMNSTGRVQLPGTAVWRRINGRQYVSALRPAFLWNVRLDVGPLWVDVLDHYETCTGRITTRGLGVVPLMSESGIDELSLTQLVRWSGLSVMVPTSFLTNPSITWEEITPNTARATITDCGLSAVHVFHFDDQARMVRSESQDRYELFPGRGYIATGSIMHRTEYGQIDGYPVPMRERVIRIEDGKEMPFLEEHFTNIILHK